MFTFQGNSLVLVGACILIGSLILIRRLIIFIPLGPVRRQWYIMAGLILLFIIGYMIYAIVFWKSYQDLANLLVPTIFFFGACFVWLTSRLTLQTANDVRRVALLEQQSITDPLTGTYNRRYLTDRLEQEFVRAKRYQLPLSILLLDIDHFKSINDTYGHQVGDLVLSHLGQLIRNRIRTSDIAARYGGEEFIILVLNTAALPAVSLAEQLRQQIESQELLLAGESDRRHAIRITASIGISEFTRETDNVEKLVQYADEALYRAKQEGRNRVIIYNRDAPKTIAP